MSEAIIPQADGPAVPIKLVTSKGSEATLAALPPAQRAQAELAKFAGKAGEAVTLTGEAGPVQVLAGIGAGDAAMPLRALPGKLAPGVYALEPSTGGPDPANVALAFALGAYRFDRYKQKHGEPAARLVAPDGGDLGELKAISHACALARDMINTPAADMGARQIETIAREVAEAFGAEVSVVVGDDLIGA